MTTAQARAALMWAVNRAARHSRPRGARSRVLEDGRRLGRLFFGDRLERPELRAYAMAWCRGLICRDLDAADRLALTVDPKYGRSSSLLSRSSASLARVDPDVLSSVAARHHDPLRNFAQLLQPASAAEMLDWRAAAIASREQIEDGTLAQIRTVCKAADAVWRAWWPQLSKAVEPIPRVRLEQLLPRDLIGEGRVATIVLLTVGLARRRPARFEKLVRILEDV